MKIVKGVEPKGVFQKLTNSGQVYEHGGEFYMRIGRGMVNLSTGVLIDSGLWNQDSLFIHYPNAELHIPR